MNRNGIQLELMLRSDAYRLAAQWASRGQRPWAAPPIGVFTHRGVAPPTDAQGHHPLVLLLIFYWFATFAVCTIKYAAPFRYAIDCSISKDSSGFFGILRDPGGGILSDPVGFSRSFLERNRVMEACRGCQGARVVGAVIDRPQQKRKWTRRRKWRKSTQRGNARRKEEQGQPDEKEQQRETTKWLYLTY